MYLGASSSALQTLRLFERKVVSSHRFGYRVHFTAARAAAFTPDFSSIEPSERIKSHQMSTSDGKRKKSHHFTPNKKQFSRDKFIQGITGFLVTCNNKERGALAESYDLLASFLPEDDTDQQFDSKSCSDSAAAMAAELTKQKSRKYKQVDTYVRNILFIQLLLPHNPDPLVIMKSIFADIEKKQKAPCRFICRMLPVHTTCSATLESIEKCIITLMDKLYPSKDESSTFVMNVTRRSCDHITSHEVIEVISRSILNLRPKWSVDFDDPKITVNVDILIKIACIGLVPDVKHYRRYNLLEYAKKFSCTSELISDSKTSSGTTPTELNLPTESEQETEGSVTTEETKTEQKDAIELPQAEVKVDKDSVKPAETMNVE